ncbi:MAG: heavy metal translocating P-type ATPase, partial [Rhodospirillaceae bacterium]|nr:heavy metal translocating P-type ATPase [Rhodospirillaceae bacterium]
MVADYRRRFWISAVLTVPVLALSPMIQTMLGLGQSWRFSGDGLVLFAAASVIYLYGGWPFLQGLAREARARTPGMMTLIGVAISAAYLYSAAVVFGLNGMPFFWELATLIDIMLLGHWIEMKSVMGAGQALQQLARLMPDTAHKLAADGAAIDVPVATLVAGDTVLVKPGEKIPVDGAVLKGETAVNESMLTGESVPVAKAPGASVIGGAINGDGAIVVEVRKTGAETFLSGVIRLVEEAQASKSRTQDLANRAAFWLTLIALGGGAATLAGWLALSDAGLAFAMERAVTVMVIACPHALGLAVPLVVAVSTSIAAANGLLIRDRTAFEDGRNTQAIIFDKTGTLTEGAFGITDVLVLDAGFTADHVVAYAAAIEAHSEHPIARGIVRHVADLLGVDGFRAIPGRGAEGTVRGRRVRVVSPGYLREHGLAADPARLAGLSAQGKTVVFVLIDDTLAGAIALADVIRPESKPAIARLKSMG